MELVKRCEKLYGDGLFSPARLQLVLATDIKLQNIIQDTNNRLIKVYRSSRYTAVRK